VSADVEIALSVLICSTHTRWDNFGQEIQRQIWGQLEKLHPLDQKRVQIIMLTDNKQMMLGHKRNVMVDMAQGRYVVFLDDDDRIEPEYLGRLLSATAFNADVITFLVSVSVNGADPRICVYSKDFPHDSNSSGGYQRIPNHICAVKRELALQASFPNLVYGEDSSYSKILHPLLKTEYAIDRVLYHYDFNAETTEAQEHLRAPLRVRGQPPIVDVVMMSNGKDRKLAQMTQDAIDTCIAGANSLPVHIIVIEQADNVVYRHAVTVPQTTGEPFSYNKRANFGARLGTADWIVFANNDLVFHDGWLHALLAAKHPVVSPFNPGDTRHDMLTENESGYVNGRHFCGWCFMMSRETWSRIGGLDPDFAFWCADDAVVEQLRAIDVAPMVVHDAVVEHLRSKTLDTTYDPDSDLTWGGIERFVEKYGAHPLADDPRYRGWKQMRELSQ
jgi:hypothetical protein